jgi:hypothetical protein
MSAVYSMRQLAAMASASQRDATVPLPTSTAQYDLGRPRPQRIRPQHPQLAAILSADPQAAPFRHSQARKPGLGGTFRNNPDSPAAQLKRSRRPGRDFLPDHLKVIDGDPRADSEPFHHSQLLHTDLEAGPWSRPWSSHPQDASTGARPSRAIRAPIPAAPHRPRGRPLVETLVQPSPGCQRRRQALEGDPQSKPNGRIWPPSRNHVRMKT